MSVVLLPDDDPSTIIGFGLGSYGNSGDLVMVEHHESNVAVTEFPIERGGKGSDHIRQLPPVFSVDVFVTNTPITTDEIMGRGFETTEEFDFPKYAIPTEATPGGVFRALGGALDALIGSQPAPLKVKVLTFDSVFDRPTEIWEQLTTLQKKGTIFTIVTSIKIYVEMVIESISLPRDSPGGADISIGFKTLKTVSTANVKAPKPAEKRGAPKTSAGAQSPKTGGDAVKGSSLAIKAIQMFGGFGEVLGNPLGGALP